MHYCYICKKKGHSACEKDICPYYVEQFAKLSITDRTTRVVPQNTARLIDNINTIVSQASQLILLKKAVNPLDLTAIACATVGEDVVDE